MKNYIVILPYAKLISPSSQNEGKTLLQTIERVGRTSHRSEDSQTEDSYKRFISTVVLGHGDWSIVEMASAEVEFMVDRGVSHEIVRHRLFSYTQESQRFVNYSKKVGLKFIEPIGLDDYARACWDSAMQHASNIYFSLLSLDYPPQIARSVLPNSTATKLIMKGNLRQWRHFLRMRTTKEAHPSMREVTIPLLTQFQSTIPLLFDDIVPGALQRENLQKAC